MEQSEYFERIMGTQINLDPESVKLEPGAIILTVNSYPHSGRWLKLRNILHDNNLEHEGEDAVPFAVVLKNGKEQSTYEIGKIVLDMDIYAKIMQSFIGYEPVLFKYNQKDNPEIVKESLINTIKVPLEDDDYGLN